MINLIECSFQEDLKLLREFHGNRVQLMKCAEECAELAAATLRYNRAQMIEETADVLITAMNNREILGAGLVDAEIQFKLGRVKERIAQEQSP